MASYTSLFFAYTDVSPYLQSQRKLNGKYLLYQVKSCHAASFEVPRARSGFYSKSLLKLIVTYFNSTILNFYLASISVAICYLSRSPLFFGILQIDLQGLGMGLISSMFQGLFYQSMKALQIQLMHS